jgi:hypothetical protein
MSQHRIFISALLCSFSGKITLFPAYNHVSVIVYTKNFLRCFLQVKKMVKPEVFSNISTSPPNKLMPSLLPIDIILYKNIFFLFLHQFLHVKNSNASTFAFLDHAGGQA